MVGQSYHAIKKALSLWSYFLMSPTVPPQTLELISLGIHWFMSWLRCWVVPFRSGALFMSYTCAFRYDPPVDPGHSTGVTQKQMNSVAYWPMCWRVGCLEDKFHSLQRSNLIKSTVAPALSNTGTPRNSKVAQECHQSRLLLEVPFCMSHPSTHPSIRLPDTILHM